MTQAPGGLRELGADAAAAWDRVLAGAVAEAKPPPQTLPAADERTREPTGADWLAMPARIQSCLGRRQAHALLDWRTDDGDEGRRLHQEEYLEWRVVRTDDGKPRRIEMTTEFGDYWKVLAGHQPHETLKLVASFAGEEMIAPRAVYGDFDPFGAAVDPSQRSAAFAATMLAEGGEPVVSPYNNGQRAICCMVEGSNTLGALINLVAASAEPHVVVDSVTKERRPMSGSEAIEVIREAAAQDCRSSDPAVVERVVRLATEGRLVAFDDPIGVYIRGVEHGQLVDPDGSDVPAEWFELCRGIGPDEAADGRPRYQRLAFEVPKGAGFTLGDLKQRGTGDLVAHGAQLAELVTLGVYVRTSAAGVIAVAPEPEALRAVTPCPEQPGCHEVRANWEAFERAERERTT
jgi:hypothetical protein